MSLWDSKPGGLQASSGKNAESSLMEPAEKRAALGRSRAQKAHWRVSIDQDPVIYASLKKQKGTLWGCGASILHVVVLSCF